MKKYILPLMALFMLGATANAQDVWTKFSCMQDNTNKNLLFIPEGTETAKRCTFFDGETAWNYREIRTEEDSYHVTLHSGCMHVEPGSLSSIEFSLPDDRRIQRVQEGGYYIPIMRTLPFFFSTRIIGRNAQGEVLFSENYSCKGIQ